MSEVRVRALLLAVGLLVGGYGAWLLLDVSPPRLVGIGLTLAAVVLVHDGVLVPSTLLVLAVGTRVLPHRWRAPVAAGLVVLATVTLAAVPVLGRFGANPGNPTVADRDYTAGWLAFAALVCAGVLLAGWRRTDRGEE